MSSDALLHADVTISFVSALDEEHATKHVLPFVSAEEYRFYVAEVGVYRVLEGRKIVVILEPGANQAEIRLFLLGSAWGALCYQRGLLVLHASAVRVDSEAVAFCAPAGGGKSSLAAWLNARGHSLISDDLCRFEVSTDGKACVYPSPLRLKLWLDALNALGWTSDKLQRDQLRFEKFHVPLTDDPAQEPLPLSAIYLLEWGELGVTRLSGSVALRRFLSAATYRGDLLKAMGVSGAYWQRCLKLLQRVPVWELRRPRDLCAMSKTVDLLENHW